MVLEKNYKIIDIKSFEFRNGNLILNDMSNEIDFEKIILEKNTNLIQKSIKFNQNDLNITLNLDKSDINDLRGNYKIFGLKNNKKYIFRYDLMTNNNIWEQKKKLGIIAQNPFDFYLGVDQNNLLGFCIDVAANVDSEILKIPYTGRLDKVIEDNEFINISANFQLKNKFINIKENNIKPSFFLVRSAEQSQLKPQNYELYYDEKDSLYKCNAIFKKENFGMMGQWSFGFEVKIKNCCFKLKIKRTSDEIYNNIFSIGEKNWFDSTLPNVVIDPQYMSNGNFILRSRPKTKLETNKSLENMKHAYQFYIMQKNLVLPNKRSEKAVRLVFERETWFAQDNAYAIFKEAKKNHKDKNELKYVIDPESPQYAKVKAFGDDNIIDLYSVEYFYALLTAKELITSIFPLEILSLYKTSSFFVNKIREIPVYYLGHGVLALKRMTADYSYKSGLYDRVSVGTNFEYKIHREFLGFPRDRVRKLGYPRWDEFNNIEPLKNRNILYFPTWRPWIDKLSDNEFIQSEYFNKIKKFLQNKEMLRNLEKYNVKLMVYLHPNIRRFSHILYKNNESKYVEIVDSSAKTVEQLEMESMLVISDYSSVVWDFAVQKKPTIFYQFDLKKYEAMQGGYFDLENIPYGNAVVNLNDLNDTLEKYLKSNILDNQQNDYIDRSFYNFKSISAKVLVDIMSDTVPKKYKKYNMTFEKLNNIWDSSEG